MSSVAPVFSGPCSNGLPQPAIEVPAWYAAYTAPRHEKAAAEHLRRKSVEVFLPVYDVVRNWNGRRAMVTLPLFPSYVFVRIRASDRLHVLEVPQVVRIVSFNGRLAALPEADIEALRTALQARNSRPHPYTASGTRVRIAAGPLRGLEGIVQREKGSTRIVVSVDMIMKSVSLELDAADLDLIEGPKHG
jgi:transcription elongation factor/antiterminator RfaH